MRRTAGGKNRTALTLFLGLSLIVLEGEALGMFGGSRAFGAPISFDLGSDALFLSGDLSALESVYSLRVIENAEDYRLPAGARLIQAENLEGGLRLMFVAGRVSASGRCSDVRLLLLRGAEGPGGRERIIQRLNLGEGEAPQMQTLSFEGADAVFVRIMREGFNAEAFVYSLSRAKAPKLTERLRVDRNFHLRAGLNVSGTLQSGGYVDVVSVKPEKKERLDLSDPDAADELIAQGLYQPNGEPVGTLRKLACSRAGFEGVEVISGNRIRVGLSLTSLSKKRVVEVTATLESPNGVTWDVTAVDFEPFLPYRLE